MDRSPTNPESRSFPPYHRDGDGAEIEGPANPYHRTSMRDDDDEGATEYRASRRRDDVQYGQYRGQGGGGGGGGGGGSPSRPSTVMNFASPSSPRNNVDDDDSMSLQSSSMLSTSNNNTNNNLQHLSDHYYHRNDSYIKPAASSASHSYTRPDRVPSRLRSFPSSTSTTSSSQPGPISSPPHSTSPFPSIGQSPDLGRWIPAPPTDRQHGPLPPLTLMNPLRRESIDGFATGSTPGQLPLSALGSQHFNRHSPPPPPAPGISLIPHTSGLFLPPNPYPTSIYPQPRRHGDMMHGNAISMFPMAPPVLESAASTSAEPGPGPKSSRRGSSTAAPAGSRMVDGVSRRQADGHEDGISGPDIISTGPLGREGWQLSVVQQPERARLCSFKEENETIDRRPVDPPPVVKLTRSGQSIEEMVVASVRVRAIVVSATPTVQRNKPSDHSDPFDFEERRLAQGADATTGETTQGLDQLQDLYGQMGVFAVFGKLSVRVPGVFRLRFELFETISGQERGLAACVSEPFEVFSPKQFKGMKESTALTRHFASQGFKIKLRQDGAAGRGGRKRKAADGNGGNEGNRRPPARTRPKLAEAGGDVPGSAMAVMRIDPVQSRRSSGSAMGRQDGGAEDYMDGYMDGTGDEPMPTHESGEPSHSTSRADGKVLLPPIGRVLKRSSIWSGIPLDADPTTTSTLDGDEDVRLVGGVAFEDGIRYGGDDGGLPPMSFGRLPSMLSEGILPTTPGGYMGPSDPANFSLKRFAAPVNSHNNNPVAPHADNLYDRLDGSSNRPPALSTRPFMPVSSSHPPLQNHYSGYDDREAFSSAVPRKPFNLAIPTPRKVEEDGEGPPTASSSSSFRMGQ